MSVELPTSGRIAGGRHTMPLRVYFEDTDLTGIVYHANYLRYMERGRTEMLRCLGIVQTEVMRDGTGYYAVHKVELTYHRPARLDDDLTVVTRVIEVRAATTKLEQNVWRGGELLCGGIVTAAFLDMDGRPRRQSKLWGTRFTELMQEAELA